MFEKKETNGSPNAALSVGNQPQMLHDIKYRYEGRLLRVQKAESTYNVCFFVLQLI